MKLTIRLSVPALILCVLVGVLVGAGGYTAYYGEALSYLSDDPRACVNCHVMREHYDGWQKASHHGVATCNDCHLPQEFVPRYWVKAENGLRHSARFTLQDFHEPIRIRPGNARVLRDNCVRCHRETVGEILAHSGREIDRLDCVRCHDRVGHGPTR